LKSFATPMVIIRKKNSILKINIFRSETLLKTFINLKLIPCAFSKKGINISRFHPIFMGKNVECMNIQWFLTLSKKCIEYVLSWAWKLLMIPTHQQFEYQASTTSFVTPLWMFNISGIDIIVKCSPSHTRVSIHHCCQ
jgi:hypothetical protein